MFDSRAVLNLLSVPHNILIPRGEATWGDRIGWFFTNLLGSVVVLAVGVGIALGLRALARVCLRISGCEAKLAELLCRVLFAACVALALVAAVGKWGVSGYWFGSAITWLLGVFTLVVAVACIGPARNFMAGVAIRSGKRLRDGDVLEKDGARGEILEVGTFFTVLGCEGGGEVLLANASLLEGCARRREAEASSGGS